MLKTVLKQAMASEGISNATINRVLDRLVGKETSAEIEEIPVSVPSGPTNTIIIHTDYSPKANIVTGPFNKEGFRRVKDEYLKKERFKYNSRLQCGPGWMKPKSAISATEIKRKIDSFGFSCVIKGSSEDSTPIKKSVTSIGPPDDEEEEIKRPRLLGRHGSTPSSPVDSSQSSEETFEESSESEESQFVIQDPREPIFENKKSLIEKETGFQFRKFGEEYVVIRGPKKTHIDINVVEVCERHGWSFLTKEFLDRLTPSRRKRYAKYAYHFTKEELGLSSSE